MRSRSSAGRRCGILGFTPVGTALLAGLPLTLPLAVIALLIGVPLGGSTTPCWAWRAAKSSSCAAPWGSGKSTLIPCINRIEQHDGGRIAFEGATLHDSRMGSGGS